MKMSPFRLSHTGRQRGFTLLEILLASSAAALVLLAVYGIFSRALMLRDNATQRTHDARLRARATKVIRNDLRNALISGGLLAATLTGSSTGSDGLNNSGFPGYLKFTTTTGKDAANEFYGDVQQVEYYIVRDSTNASGTLVRALNRDLLASVQQNAAEEQVLTGVQSLQVSFFDGANWQTSWQFASNTTSTSSSTTGGTATQTLPEAIRVEIAQAAPSARELAPPPLEILVTWNTQPFAAATPVPATSSATATPTPTPTPTASPRATR